MTTLFTERAAAERIVKFMRTIAHLRYVVVDTETTSLRGQVIQVAACGLDASLKPLFEYKQYWTTSDPIDPNAYAVHGIAADVLRRFGVAPRDGLQKLQRLCTPRCTFVAHNVSFDLARLKDTARSHGTTFEARGGTFCTMRSSKEVCALSGGNGRRFKYPKNVELYRFLFPDAPPATGLHDALVDVRLTAQNFVEGTKRGIWKANENANVNGAATKPSLKRTASVDGLPPSKRAPPPVAAPPPLPVLRS